MFIMNNVDIEDTLQDIDKTKIRTAIQLHTPIEVTTYTLPRNMEVYIHDVLNDFLCFASHSCCFPYFRGRHVIAVYAHHSLVGVVNLEH